MPTAFMSMLPRPCATGLLRPKRLFEVDGTTGGAPSSHCGLEARGGHGLPPATAPSIMPESARGELQGGPPEAVEGAGPGALSRRRIAGPVHPPEIPSRRARACPLHHASHGPPPSSPCDGGGSESAMSPRARAC